MPFLRNFTINIVYSGLVIIILSDEGMVEHWDGGRHLWKVIQGMIS